MEEHLVFTDLRPLGATASYSPSPLLSSAVPFISSSPLITPSPILTSSPLLDISPAQLAPLPDSSSTQLYNLPSSSSDSQGSPEQTEAQNKSNDSTGSPRLCRICSDKSDGAHFGVDSCRACAAFFRRSIVMKKKYVCRQGGHNCNINKSVRCMCRKCRFVKCLQCGMLPESVQTKNEASSSSQSSFPSAATQPISPDSCNSSISPSIASPQAIYPNGVTKLLQIDQNYKLLCSLRRSTEMSMSANDLRGIFDSTAQEMRPTTFGVLNKLVKASIPMLADFCSQSFPQFGELAQEEKWSVFQNFLGAMWNTETIYRTFKIFPHDMSKKVASSTTYIDLDDLETFFSDTTTILDVKHFSNLMRKNVMDTVRRIVRMLSRVDVSDMEFAALLALLMWPPYLPNASERVIEMALCIRELIFRELHVYYSTILRMDDYAGRLGELMSLYSSLQWSTNRMKEDMEILKLFDVFTEDAFLYDLIKT